MQGNQTVMEGRDTEERNFHGSTCGKADMVDMQKIVVEQFAYVESSERLQRNNLEVACGSQPIYKAIHRAAGECVENLFERPHGDLHLLMMSSILLKICVRSCSSATARSEQMSSAVNPTIKRG